MYFNEDARLAFRELGVPSTCYSAMVTDVVREYPYIVIFLWSVGE
jgi:hypothetical protein